MYTDKFIKIPVIKYDREQQDLLDKDPNDCDQYETYRRINPFHILAYEPSIPKGKELSKENEIWTYLFMTGGYDFYVPITIEEFEKILNAIK